MTRPHVKNGYRVVWDIGWWLEYETADEALDLYLALRGLPAFQDDLFRPRIVRVQNGELQFDPALPRAAA